MKLNYTAIILAILLAGITWFLPNPFLTKEKIVTRVFSGKDTSKVESTIDTIMIESNDSLILKKFTKPKRSANKGIFISTNIDSVTVPSLIFGNTDFSIYETEIDTVLNKDSLLIRSRTYVDVKTLEGYSDIEFALHPGPRPKLIETQKIYVPVYEEAESQSTSKTLNYVLTGAVAVLSLFTLYLASK